MCRSAGRSVPRLDRLKIFVKSAAWTRLELPRSSDFRATIGLASTHGSAPTAVLDAGLRRLGEPSPPRDDRVSPRGEPLSSRAAWRQTPPVHRRSATAPCSTRSSDRTAPAGGDRHARWSRYAASLVRWHSQPGGSCHKQRYRPKIPLVPPMRIPLVPPMLYCSSPTTPRSRL